MFTRFVLCNLRADRVHQMKKLTALLSLIVLCACGSQDDRGRRPESLPQWEWMTGRVVTDTPLLVVPNTNWAVDRERELWGFAASASLAIHVQESLSEPLHLTFVVDLGNPEDLHASMDGLPIPAPWSTVDGARLSFHVPADALQPGTHALTLIRTDRATVEGTTDALRFSEIRWQTGSVVDRLNPDRVHRYRYIAAFLLDGVTGSQSTERLGGVLFIGSGQTALPVSVFGPSTIHFTVQNSSPVLARFTVESPGGTISHEVESHGKTVITADLSTESSEVVLRVDGPPDGLYLWGAPVIRDSAALRTPPIVLITLDTTRRDVVPPWSDNSGLMPNVAKMVGHATVFNRAVATSPWTLPSHASIFTGLYPSHHRAGVTDQELTPSFTTIAELLRSSGQLTAGFAGGFFCASRFGLSQGFAVYHQPADFEVPAEALTDLVLAFLDEYADVAPFLFINYFDPHFPYRAPDRLRTVAGPDSTTLPDSTAAIWQEILDGDGGAWTRANVEDIPFPAQALASIHSQYRTEVAFMDEQIGRLMQALHRHDLYDSALIILVADHGELLGEHRILGHGGRLDPELVEVPLIIKFPHQAHAAVRNDLVSIADLFATTLTVAGLEPPPSDGATLSGDGDTGDRIRTLVFSEEHEMGIHELYGRLKIADHLYGVEGLAERQIVWSSGRDCFVQRDSSWEVAQCSAEDTMALVEALLDPPELLAGQAETDLDAAALEKLRALGYVQ